MIINDKVYGEQKVDNPLIIELINSPEMQRLKGVGQYSTWKLIDPKLNTTRFEHCFGVCCLLKKFGADFDEQIAGLLHDINHTAFSHVIDYVVGDPSTQDYGDSQHKEIFMNSTIPPLLRKRDMDVNKIANPHNFGLLERDLPDICCDRLDYCLRDGICCEFIDQKEAGRILSGLVIHNGEIICRNRESALLIAKLYLKMSKFLWSNEVQAGSLLLLAEAMKIALKNNIIGENDFYTTDEVLMNKLMRSKNEKIIELIESIKVDSVILGTKRDYDIFSRSKVRYIDPKFIDNGKLKRLSEVDAGFKKEIDDFKKWIEKGFYIKIKK